MKTRRPAPGGASVGRAAGAAFFKIDFLYAGALAPGGVAALREGLMAIRAGAGDAHLNACGAPPLPVADLVDSIRIGADAAYDGVEYGWALVAAARGLARRRRPAAAGGLRLEGARGAPRARLISFDPRRLHALVDAPMREPITTAGAPAAIGPYSQAVRVARNATELAPRLLFCSGQIPLDPATGQLVDGDAAAQAERVLENLKAVLAAAGRAMSDVAKTTIYLTDLADFARVNEVYGRYFQAPFPARSTVQVSALPRGAKVEIEAIAVG